MGYEPLYVAYLIYFNRDRDYFECHEVLEELWLSKDRDPLYKALLQVAVGLYHYRNGNARGAIIMLEGAAAKLREYPEITLGIHLGKLVRETEDYIQRLREYDNLPYYDLTIDIVDGKLSEAVHAALPDIKPNIPQRRGPRRE
ncbi:hypothetical protein SAMN04487895_11588 [Paenibacillus sophorae]|uniref:DUF309 domain-containing protein n=1 Tax=Paenibacillus sophorae TaxID=1333845 RepID=A0A1H8TYV3_9BACL|nr:DUF309 domain-containing protein [Paenibacillus sophorae]QWU18078.1 DUF309 domain-containing protein [Paenibacillus sophorae]SEO95608.1 hypothetical protein SAMN04487895_11588 [Paenibacillus sophorae]